MERKVSCRPTDLLLWGGGISSSDEVLSKKTARA